MDDQDDVIELPQSNFPNNSNTYFSSKIRVLVVDDDDLTRMILKVTMKKAGYRVVIVEGAKEALDLFYEKRNQFDLLLTDIHMLNMNGFQLLKIAKKEFRIPVVLMSVDDSENTMKEGLNRGAVFFYPKPMLILNIKSLCQYVYKNQPEKFQFPMQPQGSSEDRSNSLSSTNKVNRGVRNYTSKKKSKEGINHQHTTLRSENKSRVIWTSTLHSKFEKAIQEIGNIHQTIPVRILKLMGVKGLKRTHVASHLQKYRQIIRARCFNGDIPENFEIGSTSRHDPWLSKGRRRRLVPNRLPRGAQTDPWISRGEERDPWLSRGPVSVSTLLPNQSPQEERTDSFSKGQGSTFMPDGLPPGEQTTLLPNQPGLGDDINVPNAFNCTSPFPTQFHDDQELPRVGDILKAQGSNENSVPFINEGSFLELLLNGDAQENVSDSDYGMNPPSYESDVEVARWFLQILHGHEISQLITGPTNQSLENQEKFPSLANSNTDNDMGFFGDWNEERFEMYAGGDNVFGQTGDSTSEMMDEVLNGLWVVGADESWRMAFNSLQIMPPEIVIEQQQDTEESLIDPQSDFQNELAGLEMYASGDNPINDSGTTIGEMLNSFNKQLDEEENGFGFMAKDDFSSMASNNSQIMPPEPVTEQQEQHDVEIFVDPQSDFQNELAGLEMYASGDNTINHNGTTIGEMLNSFNKQLDEEENDFGIIAEDDSSSMASKNSQIMPPEPVTEQQEQHGVESFIDPVSDLRDALASLPSDESQNANQACLGNNFEFDDPDDSIFEPMWFTSGDYSNGV